MFEDNYDEEETMDIYSEDFLNGFIEGIQDAIDSQDVDIRPFLKLLPEDWEERIYNYSSIICTNVKNYDINFENIYEEDFDLAFEDLENLIYKSGFKLNLLIQIGRQSGWLGFNLSDLVDNGLLIPADKRQIKEWINENPLTIKYYTENEYLYYGDPLDVGREVIKNCDSDNLISLVAINPELISLLDSIRKKIDNYFNSWEKDYDF